MESNELPLVSIQCLVYNHEPYLRQCLDGFVMQKTNFKFEAIVHDDLSTDGSAAIIREYAEKYPDIIKPIFETENQYSKHDGSLDRIMHEACKGKYIALCEGDDYWIDPLKLQKQVDFMEANPDYSLCFHNVMRLYENEKKRPNAFNSLRESCDISLQQIISSWIIPTASICVKSLVFKHYPLWTKEIYSGDLTLSLIAYDLGKIRYLNDCMSVYRICSTNSSATAALRMKEAGFLQSEHIKLYNYYNTYTNGRYNKIISSHIKKLEKEKIYKINASKFLGSDHPPLCTLNFVFKSVFIASRILFVLGMGTSV